ncbi:MAG: zinc ABC transporter substrate-binding protein, partial [Hyphomicrobiales bacterium]|nr:zinc ABC transporter substrate-binding protein [Hyphomicrobiales bacterium]
MKARFVSVWLFASILGLAAMPTMAQTNDKTIKIVAAENFYGDIAQQLAGDNAQITSILSNPDEDPHLFEASPSVAR